MLHLTIFRHSWVFYMKTRIQLMEAGMQNILDTLQKYVPEYEENCIMKYAEQGIIGDQLTVDAVFEVASGFTAKDRHDVLHFEKADFHGGMKFLKV